MGNYRQCLRAMQGQRNRVFLWSCYNDNFKEIYWHNDDKILQLYCSYLSVFSIVNIMRRKGSTLSSGARIAITTPKNHIMNIRFTKMHGLGNDFMVIDAVRQKIDLSPAQIAALAQRDTGIGFDQCLLIEKSHQEGIDFFYRIFNADGNEVGQCGNGARCLARFVHYYGLSTKQTLHVATNTTLMQLHINKDNSVTVDMGKPKLQPADIPLLTKKQDVLYSLPIANDNPCSIHAISVGNPHAVIVVPDITTASVNVLGKKISEHPLFPEQTNTGFMQIINPNHILLRVYERGCGETRACGSGAVAAAAIGRLYHQLIEHVTVSLPGGDLLVSWPALDGSICLTGPATFVYEGELI